MLDSGIRLLIVEDNPDMLETMVTHMASLCSEVLSAKDGVEAVKHLEKTDFDIVITDIRMPHMDGMELLRHIKQHYPQTDVVVITGFSEKYPCMDFLDAGAIDYLSKPFTREEFHAKINRVVRERQLVSSLKKEIIERKQAEKSLKNAHDELEEIVAERTSELVATNASLRKEVAYRSLLEKERQEIQIKAMIQDKLASLGQMATGVAHEINQPLTYIMTILNTTIEKFKQNKINPDKQIVKFRKAVQQAERILGITTHLLTTGRKGSAKREDVDLSAILDDSLVLMNEKLKLRNISLLTSIPDNIPAIVGIYNKLEQVFINLITNAIDALEKKGGGEITVEMVSETDQMLIRFSDNGSGMPPEVREKIFEPFYTTKERGKGTGLGMAIINDIIVDHNGGITCESEQGKGTTFTVTLPLAKKDS